MNFKHVLIILLAALLLPGLALAQTTRATFDVEKVWDEPTPGNPASVKVTLDCFTGLPLTQSQNITADQGVTFVVTDFESGALDCSVTEGDVAGYTAKYNNGRGCNFPDTTDGAARTCVVVNTPIPQQVAVTKDWVIAGSGGDALDPAYSLILLCDEEIVGGEYCDFPTLQGGNKSGSYGECDGNSGQWIKVLTKTGTGDTEDATYTADVVPDWENGTDCEVHENVYDSSVEVDTDCDGLTVSIGEGTECTVTNTVFYEGIPTLSQYGMAIMALLMLGVGFVGFRRFV